MLTNRYSVSKSISAGQSIMQVSGIAMALPGDALKCKTDYANNICKSSARPNRPGTRVHFRTGGIAMDNSIAKRLAMNHGRTS